MSDLLLDGDRDLALSAAGDLSLALDLDAQAQRIGIRLRTFRGEWFLNTAFGVPYFDSVLVKPIRGEVLTSVFKTALLRSPGVTEIAELVLDADARARELSVSFKVKTDLGEIVGGVAANA